ncbi:hypothetical protein BTJ44_01156 [Bacillus mycoides]|nr:hypothetical protein BTJ44_01156 [Bacillus mycoides]
MSKVDNLHFYKSLSWEDKDVAGVVDETVQNRIKFIIAKIWDFVL